MEEEQKTMVPDVDRVEKLFLFSGIVLLLAMAAIIPLLAAIGDNDLKPTVVGRNYLPSAALAVLLCVLNFRSWKIFVGMTIEKRADFQIEAGNPGTKNRMQIVFAVILKLISISLLYFFFTSAGGSQIACFALTFGAMLVLGGLFVAAFFYFANCNAKPG